MELSILQLSDYENRFAGRMSAHGVHIESNEKEDNGKKKGKSFTKKEPVTREVILDHLSGKTGLGIVPIAEDNTCKFSVIDIDDYTDTTEFVRIVFKHNLPLAPFRSKSGGLHLYLFYSEKIPASEAIGLMQVYARILGLPKTVEIFPKQANLAPDTIGNWINLPYYDAEHTKRYLYRRDLTPALFQEAMDYVGSVAFTLEKHKAALNDLPLADAPPCLQCLYMRSATNNRNMYLFSLARYFKAKLGDEFDFAVIQANNDLSKPLPLAEVTDTIIQSHKKKDYSYKCSEPPILELCNKDVCRMRKYGIGGDEISELSFEQFFQYRTDPPYYEWFVNGVPLKFFSEADIIHQNAFREQCFRHLHILPMELKRPMWARIVNTALRNVEIKAVEDDEDISPGALFREYLVEFLTRRAMAANKEQILIDRVYKDMDRRCYVFKSKNLMLFLIHQKQFRAYGQTEIFSRLKAMGGASERYYVNLKNKNVRVWMLPLDSIDKYVDMEIDQIAIDFMEGMKEDDY